MRQNKSCWHKIKMKREIKFWKRKLVLQHSWKSAWDESLRRPYDEIHKQDSKRNYFYK